MGKTKLQICNTKFLINGELTYSEYPDCPEENRGLLMNARFIQGIFDDKADASRFERFGRHFDPEENTASLIAALPEWYAHGLRAFTVGFQGGGPCFTMADLQSIDNNPFSEDGMHIDRRYLDRMHRIIEAADELGMVVIVSCFYGHQVRFLRDDIAVMEAVKSVSNWLRDQGYTNVILEIANEHNIDPYKVHPILYDEKGIVELLHIARRESAGILVGCSSTNSYFPEKIARESDVILIHGNNMPRQDFYNYIQLVKKIKPERPIVCNEDSQALGNMWVALNEGISWGYYNNMTKQEPPVAWQITEGEDRFYAMRMRESFGIGGNTLQPEEQFYLQGLKADETCDGKRWIRLASMYPETIKKVIFKRNGVYFATAYDDPFTIHYIVNWLQGPVEGIEEGEVWTAEVYLADGSVIVKEAVAEQDDNRY